MLATRLEDPRRLADPRYSAEPKLDGQRAQLHVRDHRSLHVFSRPGRELIRLPGLAWLQEVRWPVAAAVLDGEAVAGDGSEGIQAVFEARHRPGTAPWRSSRSTVSPCPTSGEHPVALPGATVRRRGRHRRPTGATRIGRARSCLRIVPIAPPQPSKTRG